MKAIVAAVSQAEFVAWACFVVGIVLLGVGVFIGLSASLKQAKTKLTEAETKLDEAQEHIRNTRSVMAESFQEGVSSGAPQVTRAVEAAGESTEAAKSALDQVKGILSALPENLRFAGLLIVVGTVLMSVATVQFGGISLF